MDVVNAVNDAKDAFPIIEKKTIQKYNIKVKRELGHICRNAVDLFYSKDDFSYDRFGDLYNAFKVVVNNNEWSVYYGPEFMKHKHHQKNEIIYNNSFVNGYHGGSWGKEDINGFQPPEGIPYYRGPGKGSFKYWTYPAEETKDQEGPYKIMDPQVNEYLDQAIIDRQEEANELAQVYIDKAERAVNRLIGR